jgi:ferric-dicitrate binding protein FerR (iron transport regulator)
MNATINKDFIFNYLAGKSTALQKQLVDEWVKNPNHEELFYQWLVEYEYQQPQYLTQVDEAIHRFQNFAEGKGVRYPTESEIQALAPVRNRTWWGVAASLALVLTASGLIFKNSIVYQTYESAVGETKTFILSDSTQVVLTANSSLKVPRFGFGRETREVFLTGEANFDVSHQANDQRFVVRTERGVEVVVLGTEFTVYARPEKSKVILNRGKVQLRYREGKAEKQIMMKPGELVMLDQNNHLEQQVVTQTDQNAALKDHRFIFDDTTLAEFAEMMQESYGIRVVIQDKKLAERTLVGSFRAENPKELLEIVSKIFNVEIVKSGDTILLTNK